MKEETIKQAVREHYGATARQGSGGCGVQSQGCCGGGAPPAARDMSRRWATQRPRWRRYRGLEPGLAAATGALASLQPGETVLDLAPGRASTASCSASRRPFGQGHRRGHDRRYAHARPPERRAERLRQRGVPAGEIEHLPLADGSVDAVISNCVINLAPDKAQVFREAYRVLRMAGG